MPLTPAACQAPDSSRLSPWPDASQRSVAPYEELSLKVKAGILHQTST